MDVNLKISKKSIIVLSGYSNQKKSEDYLIIKKYTYSIIHCVNNKILINKNLSFKHFKFKRLFWQKVMNVKKLFL